MLCSSKEDAVLEDVLGYTVDEVIGQTKDPEQAAILIFNFVKNKILFGFTGSYDQADPCEVLREGLGNSNGKTRLFVEMLREAGFQARYHFVSVNKNELYGTLPLLRKVLHSYAEVYLGNEWISVDGYVLDHTFINSARKLLRKSKLSAGFGTTVKGKSNWDAKSPCMVQFTDLYEGAPQLCIEDFGVFEKAEDFYASSRYRRSGLNYRFPFLYKKMWANKLNINLYEIRRYHRASMETPMPTGRGPWQLSTHASITNIRSRSVSKSNASVTRSRQSPRTSIAHGHQNLHHSRNGVVGESKNDTPRERVQSQISVDI